MLEILKLFNFPTPNLSVGTDVKTKKLGSTGFNVPFEIKKEDNDLYVLYIKGQVWMKYDNNHLQAAQVFSHYYIAEGDVITTGLGLAVRENWLLNNPKVKSLTVLEKSKDLIEYHKEVNPDLFKEANIINCDAKTYKGKCDTLLLDHYEWEPMNEIINDVNNICNNNIECKKMWFWHLETQIIADLHGWYENNIWNEFREGKFKINPETFKDIKNVYENIKINHKLEKLPNLTNQELQLILTIYTEFYQIM